MSGEWIQALADCDRRGVPCVLVTITDATGSTPRAAGTKMLVTSDDLFGTIGGGALEFTAIETARALLDGRATELQLETYPLGPKLGQCCGGRVSLLYEPIRPQRLRVQLFGAGHVAQALVTVLGTLPTRVTWVDNRPGQFPESLPANVMAQLTEVPEDVLDPSASHILIMTHDHALDYRLSRAALSLAEKPFVGVIGSATKRARFVRRLADDGVAADRVAALVCPIGIATVTGKHPGEIAVAVAAQLLAGLAAPISVPETVAAACTGCPAPCGG